MITKLIGTRIAQLRHEQGLSQLALASKIGMARTYFAEVETGKRNVSARNLAKITNGLDVTLAEFFDSEVFDSLYSPAKRSSHSRKSGVNYAVVALPPLDEQSQRPSSPR